jgi:pimeloyl-ACP methyl ester carboxylesterase
MPQQQGALRELRNEPRIDRAVVFIHGFSGSRDDTWATFPNLLGTEVKDWNIFTLGYATTLLPDVLGIWSADPICRYSPTSSIWS